MGRIMERRELVAERSSWGRAREVVVFTNGCFDLLHAGHARLLGRARKLGDRLVVGLNSDASVRRLKGEGRPLTPERERAEILSALECVDAVTLFAEETPLELVRELLPDILVKGGDWPLDAIVGRAEVEAAGGRVLTIPLVQGISTTEIVRRARAGDGGPWSR